MSTILLADDSTVIRMKMKYLIEKEGHQVIGEATNGREAIDKAINLKPDLIIMDITMPYLNGFDSAKRILNILPNTKILIFSSLNQQESIIEGIKIGVTNFLTKPVENNILIDKIKEMLKEK